MSVVVARSAPGIVAWLILWLGSAYLAGWVARRKGRSFAAFFVAGIWLTPLPLLVALVLRTRSPASQAPDPGAAPSTAADAFAQRDER